MRGRAGRHGGHWLVTQAARGGKHGRREAGGTGDAKRAARAARGAAAREYRKGNEREKRAQRTGAVHHDVDERRACAGRELSQKGAGEQCGLMRLRLRVLLQAGRRRETRPRGQGARAAGARWR
jgi:hypothetical protein